MCFFLLRHWSKAITMFCSENHHTTNEPPHDKTNKMTLRPAKTQISLGTRPVWSESSLPAWRKLGSLATHSAYSEDSDQTGGCPGWSESSLGAQSVCWFCHEAAQTIRIYQKLNLSQQNIRGHPVVFLRSIRSIRSSFSDVQEKITSQVKFTLFTQSQLTCEEIEIT